MRTTTLASLAVLLFGACAIGQRPPYTYELLGVIQDYVPLLRSSAAAFYSNSPAEVLERSGGMSAYGLVPVTASDKCGGKSATETCFSIRLGAEIDKFPSDYERLLHALQSPCSTIETLGAKHDPAPFRSERMPKGGTDINVARSIFEYGNIADINGLRRIFGCDKKDRSEVVIHIEVFEGLDARVDEFLPPERRPSVAAVPRTPLKFVREFTVKVN